jgi:hypothetical protein
MKSSSTESLEQGPPHAGSKVFLAIEMWRQKPTGLGN